VGTAPPVALHVACGHDSMMEPAVLILTIVGILPDFLKIP
jgi:hypothetical protein